MNTCAECEKEAVFLETTDYHYTGCGFEVVLEGITVEKCAACGAIAPIIPDILGLHRAIAGVVVEKGPPFLEAERQFLRDFADDCEEVRELGLRGHHTPSELADVFLSAIVTTACNIHDQKAHDYVRREPQPYPAGRMTISLTRSTDGPVWGAPAMLTA